MSHGAINSAKIVVTKHQDDPNFLRRKVEQEYAELYLNSGTTGQSIVGKDYRAEFNSLAVS